MFESAIDYEKLKTRCRCASNTLRLWSKVIKIEVPRLLGLARLHMDLFKAGNDKNNKKLIIDTIRDNSDKVVAVVYKIKQKWRQLFVIGVRTVGFSCVAMGVNKFSTSAPPMLDASIYIYPPSICVRAADRAKRKQIQ